MFVDLCIVDGGNKYCEASIKHRGSCFTKSALLTEK